MNLCRISRKLFVLLIIVSFISLTLQTYIVERCIAKVSNTYQGKAFSLSGTVIGGSDFQEYIDRATQDAKEQYRLTGSKLSLARIWDYALIEAVHELAFQHEMSKNGFEVMVTNEEVEARIKKYLPTKEESKVYMDSHGFFSKEALLKAVVKDLKRKKLLLYKAKELKVKVSKVEVQEKLEQITVRHIMIGYKNSDGKIVRTEAQALARANEVYRKVLMNGDFVILAKKYSDDQGTRYMGGLLGPMSLADFKSSLVKEFVKGTLALYEGGISKPIRTQFGYHIIRLDKLEMPKGDGENISKYKEAEDEILLSKLDESIDFQIWLNELYEGAEKQMIILDPALLAYRLDLAGKWAEAAASYEKALDLEYYKDKWNVYLDAANVYLKLRQPDNALKVLKKVAKDGQNTTDYQKVLKNVNQVLDGEKKESK